MAYFPDLAPFQYGISIPSMFHVGWLDRDHPFTRGPVSLAFANELKRLGREPVEVTRGHHVCEFCRPPDDLIAAEPSYLYVWEYFRSGNGELHVSDENGLIYAAPALIVHYVSEHQYQPPPEFVAAVLRHRAIRISTKRL